MIPGLGFISMERVRSTAFFPRYGPRSEGRVERFRIEPKFGRGTPIQ
jgi:hypothetical protein